MKVLFVHIGQNPTPTLFKAAEVAMQSLPEAEVCLISDQQDLLQNFPGLTFQYDPKVVASYIALFSKKNRELKNLAGGYWLNTIVRLFALIQVAKLAPDEVIIHLESDVYLYATSTDLAIYPFAKDFVSYPRLSSTQGIASILYSPNLKTLESFLLNLKKILSENPDIANDMDLLGIALHLALARELKSIPSGDADSDEGNFIFDGAAVGQYLLGVDPVHTSGLVVSGFQNPGYPIILSSLKWSISEHGKINIHIKDMTYEVLSIHAHSKELLGHPDINDVRWKQVMSEANLEVPRVAKMQEFQDIYHGMPQFLDRIRIARKNGLFKHLRRYVIRNMEKS